MKYFKKILLLLLVAAQQNCQAFISEMPFYNSINTKSSKNWVVSPTLFLSTAFPQYGNDDLQSNRYRDFSGVKLNLVNLQNAVNYVNQANGLPAVVYLDRTDQSINQFVSNFSDMEVYMDTKSVGANISLVKQSKFPFMKYIEGSKNLKKFSGVLENTNTLCGLYIPVIQASRMAIYQPGGSYRNIFFTDQTESIGINKIEKALNAMTSSYGLQTAHWSNTGIGNLNLFAGLAYNKDDFYGFKNINAGALLLGELPTAQKRDEENPLSFAFDLPTASLGMNFFANLKVRYGISVGADFNIMLPISYTGERRVSVANEPNEFSPYKAFFETRPGTKTAFAPYLQWTFYRDITFDIKFGFTTLSQGEERIDYKGPGMGLDIMSNKKYTSTDRYKNSWNAKYWNLCMKVGTGLKVTNWLANPELLAFYDFPWNRDDVPSNHRFGVSLKFDV